MLQTLLGNTLNKLYNMGYNDILAIFAWKIILYTNEPIIWKRHTFFFLNLQGESQDYYQKSISEVFKGQVIKKKVTEYGIPFPLLIFSILCFCPA